MKLTQLLLGKTLVTGNKSKGSNFSLKINNKTPKNNFKKKIQKKTNLMVKHNAIQSIATRKNVSDG
jgi:hypothetical protein